MPFDSLAPSITAICFYLYLGIGLAFFSFMDWLTSCKISQDPKYSFVSELWQKFKLRILLYFVFMWPVLLGAVIVGIIQKAKNNER
jgi:hypothetical protein